MDILLNADKRLHESNMELCRARFTGKLCIAIVCITQIIPRILYLNSGAPHGQTEMAISVGTTASLIIMIALEYLFFKKYGPKVAKFANLWDILLLIVYTIDWLMVEVTALKGIAQTVPPTFTVNAFFGFIMFSWRTLLVTLIVQKWQLKIIPPSVATLTAGAYAIYYTPLNLGNNIVRTMFQMFNIILIMYCEDKIKWSMIWSNLQKEKWVQVNNFILNNIPENIMILDVKGEIKFISDYCKSFMKKNNLSEDGNYEDLFQKIQDLEQQYEPEFGNSTIAIQLERLTTYNELLVEDTSQNNNTGGPVKVETLEGLVTNIKKIIEEKGLQERQFLIYNGKLKGETNQQQQQQLQEKSIEIKISFVHHVENEYLILILRDTTQRDLLLTLQETNKYKDQLLASVSHELRAPLNGNINLIESAVSSLVIPDEIKESLLTPALRSGKFLLHIINDILDMSQIKQKRLRLAFQSGNLRDTLKNAVQLVELQAQKKGIELSLELDPQLPKQFCTDHMRLSQIVLNLLSNAIKFTNSGTVKITAEAMTENPWVKITVEDSGIGICRGNLQKLFSGYTSIEYEDRQVINPGGTGLGLNIASNLADLLAPKGQSGISVSSIPHQGSIFSFIIENKEKAPVERLEDADQLNMSSSEVADEIPKIVRSKAPKRSTLIFSSKTTIPAIHEEKNEFENNDEEEERCCCPKILIVDDNPFNIMAFETILKSLEVKSDSVYSGSACIQKLLCRQNKACGKHCRPYSVVFMDQEMPEMTGSETVAEIKRMQGEDLIPEMKIIGCTAHKAKEVVEKFLESGLDHCIFKPISVGMIRDILKEILSS